MSERAHDFSDQLRIDPTALDVEWLNQPNLYYELAELAADAREVYDWAKANVDVVKAELYRQLKGEAKLTETALNNLIEEHPKYRAAYAGMLDARRDHAQLVNAVEAANLRKSALENLVRLVGCGYNATPLEPRNLGQEGLAHLDRAKEQMAKARVALAMRKKREAVAGAVSGDVAEPEPHVAVSEPEPTNEPDPAPETVGRRRRT